MALFYSPHAALRVVCSKTTFARHPVTGDIIGENPAAVAEFGKLGNTFTFLNPATGEETTGADIRGHYFDSDEAAEKLGWTVEVKEMVERKVRGYFAREPERGHEIIRDPAKAPLPWPTYDECDADEVLKLAPALGLVAETLAYEAENRERPAILDGLTSNEPTAEDDDEQAVPVAAVPADLVAAATGSRTISV